MDLIHQEILQLLKNNSGFEFEAYKSSMLVRRIENRMNRINCTDPKMYIELLEVSSEEKQSLIDNFMINVSHFFRNPLVFEFINKQIIPEIFVNESEPQKSMRIWSAGCSNGEEPYSLAILLHEFFEHEKINPELHFFATDADEEILKNAQKGIYSANKLDEMKFRMVNKYFKKKGDSFHISDEIKSFVSFSHDNLLDKTNYAPKESIFGGFDLILCRNVLIYFNTAYQNIIFEKFYKSLAPNRWVVLGESESIPSKFKDKFIQVNNCCKVFRRIN